MTVLTFLGLGFVLGMRHAADPDHVIAVSTIVTRHRRAGTAAWVGALWGVGHTLTILLVGGGMILFGWVIPERLGLSFEFAVAIMLIMLGLINVKGIFRVAGRGTATSSTLQHSHTHRHGDYVHTHAHGHDPEDHPHPPDKTPVAWLDRTFGSIGLFQMMRPVLIGVVHGLAGSASVALLVLATMTDARWGVIYLLLFGIGTIFGMQLITVAMALPVGYGNRRQGVFPGRLRAAAGVLSIAFGLFLAYHVGVTQGLFFGPR